jgi:hypothetical protein
VYLQITKKGTPSPFTNLGAMDTEQILSCIGKAELLRFVSYTKQRLPRRIIAKQLPEVIHVFKTFGPKSLKSWNDKLLHHNALLRRGALMRLCRTFNTAKLTHCSLDMYMLQMHSDEIAGALDCISTFGKRVQAQIADFPDSEVWTLSLDVVIQRRHWLELCRRVMNIIRLLDFNMNAGSKSQGSRQSEACLYSWPAQKILHASLEAAHEIFGTYAEADRSQSSILDLYKLRDVQDSRGSQENLE